MFFAIFLHFLACSDESDSTNKESTKVTSEKVVNETKNEVKKETVDSQKHIQRKEGIADKTQSENRWNPHSFNPDCFGWNIQKPHHRRHEQKNDAAIQNCLCPVKEKQKAKYWSSSRSTKMEQ